jgi:thioredoxin reductase
VKVSVVLALIGAQPDLKFLPNAGSGLGIKKDVPVANRSNPFDVDPFSYECTSAPGLYAIGSLAGDNFVRFVHGGALAFTSHVHKQQMLRKAEAQEVVEL